MQTNPRRELGVFHSPAHAAEALSRTCRVTSADMMEIFRGAGRWSSACCGGSRRARPAEEACRGGGAKTDRIRRWKPDRRNALAQVSKAHHPMVSAAVQSSSFSTIRLPLGQARRLDGRRGPTGSPSWSSCVPTGQNLPAPIRSRVSTRSPNAGPTSSTSSAPSCSNRMMNGGYSIAPMLGNNGRSCRRPDAPPKIVA